MERRFSAVAISGELGVAKPDPEIFRYALDRLGISPENAWHVGDSLRLDVAGAKAAQLTAVWLNRNGLERQAADPEPDFEISSLTELFEILAIAE